MEADSPRERSGLTRSKELISTNYNDLDGVDVAGKLASVYGV